MKSLHIAVSITSSHGLKVVTSLIVDILQYLSQEADLLDKRQESAV